MSYPMGFIGALLGLVVGAFVTYFVAVVSVAIVRIPFALVAAFFGPTAIRVVDIIFDVMILLAWIPMVFASVVYGFLVGRSKFQTWRV